MVGPKTADICDEDDACRFLPPRLRDYGGLTSFAGSAVTMRAPDDNSLVRTSLEELGEGRVLVVDGGASERCALLGGNLATLAERNGWAGIIIWGGVRDSHELREAKLGVKALFTIPRKSEKRGLGERDVELDLAGVRIRPGEQIIADEDGVVVR